MSEGKKFGFSFSKVQKPKFTPKKVEAEKEEIDYISAVDNNEIKSSYKRKLEEHVVIPMKAPNFGIRNIKTMWTPNQPIEIEGEKIQLKPHVLARDIQRIELKAALEMNVEEANYESIPVEKFGMGILLGMGAKPEELSQVLSSNEDRKIRPKGLGLGADPQAIKKAAEKIVNAEKILNGENEELKMKPGAKCKVIYGKHKDAYATVISVDNENERISIEIFVGKKVVEIPQSTAMLVSSVEFSRFSKYINKMQADDYNKKEKQGSSSKSKVEEEDNKNFSADLHKSLDQLFDEQFLQIKENELKHVWIQQSLIVRFIDKKYHGGRYYKQKVIIDKVKGETCVCIMENGEKLLNINSDQLQSVIPKKEGEIVRLLDVYHFGDRATFLKKSPEHKSAFVRSLSTFQLMLVHFDCLCVEAL